MSSQSQIKAQSQKLKSTSDWAGFGFKAGKLIIL